MCESLTKALVCSHSQLLSLRVEGRCGDPVGSCSQL